MARTSDAAVSLIIEVDDSISLTPFIEAASALVDDCCADAGYDTTRLELIERWLAAHFYTVRDPRTTQERAGSVGASFQSAVDLGLNTSHYGQMAMRLDTGGGLASMEQASKQGKKRKVGITYLGTTTTEQESAYDLT